MARQERAVDPMAGPLESFAYDLRKLRTEAGTPTYRALAKLAGYSPTTLSEAAGGVRMPTLDVVLAYVGACRGDAEAWRTRWHEVDAELGRSPVAERSTNVPPNCPTETPESLPDPPVVAAPEPGPASRRWIRIVALGAGVAVLLAISAAAIPRVLDSSDPVGPQCPTASVGVTFTGVTYGGGAHIRTGASRGDPVLSTIPSNCTVGFTGFCIGQKVHDATAGLPDVRWFTLGGDRVVASAVIHGNPPLTLEPSRCPHDRPAPEAVTVSVTPDPTAAGAFTVTATGRNLDIVGFTASAGADPEVPGALAWRQLALTETEDAIFRTRLTLDPAAPDDRIFVAAAACLGGNGPTSVVEASEVGPEGARPGSAALSAAQLTMAARSACEYPSRG